MNQLSKIFLFLFGLLTLSPHAPAQQNQRQLMYSVKRTESGGFTKYYDPLPDRIEFTGDSTTLNAGTMGSSISQSELGTGIRFGSVPLTYTNTLRASDLQGTRALPKVFQGVSPAQYSIVGGPTLPNGSNILGQTGTVSTFVIFSGLLAEGHDVGVTSMTGFKWAGRAGGSHAELRNVVLLNAQSPGLQYNGDGDAGTYGRINQLGVKIFGDSVNTTEGAYQGDTTPSTGGVVDTTYVDDKFIINTTWDGDQYNKTNKVLAKNVTVVNSGITETSGQQSLLQLQDAGDDSYYQWFLLHNAPRAAQIAARNLTFGPGYIYSEDEIFWQDVVTQAGYTSPRSTAGKTNYINGLEVFSSVSRTNGVAVHENNANFIFINCVRGTNITNLVGDSRSDVVTYKIYEINTTTASTPPAPVFNSLDPYNMDAGLVQTDYYYYKGFGFRVPYFDRNYPEITSFTASASVGQDIIITGNNFTGTTSVLIGDNQTAASAFTVDSDTQITATVATGTNSGIVIVYNANGAGAKVGFTLL